MFHYGRPIAGNTSVVIAYVSIFKPTVHDPGNSSHLNTKLIRLTVGVFVNYRRIIQSDLLYWTYMGYY